MEALPFTIRNRPGEAGEVSGICRLDDAELVLEWRRTSLIERHARSGTVRLPIEEIEGVQFRSAWFRRELILKPRSLAPIRDVPGAHDSGSLNLQVARRDRETAKELAASLGLSISGHRIDRLGRSIGL